MLKNTQTNKIIIGFVGDLASGKGTACKYLKEKHNIDSFRFSTILRGILKRVYVNENRDNLQRLSTALRNVFGQDVLSKAIASDAINDQNKIVSIDGIRRLSDIEHLKKLSGFSLVYITADSKLRWQRLVKRNENSGDDKKTYEEFLKDEQSESDKLIKETGKEAKFTILNNGSFDDFYAQIENLLKNIA